MKKLAYALIIISVLFFASCGNGRESAIILAGSTSVQPYAEILAEEFERLYGMYADIQGGGSSAGISAAISGAADIGMSSRELTEKEISGGLWYAEIAIDGLAVIVHPDNGIFGLTLSTVRGIYDGSVTEWEGTGKKIHVITREEGSGTRSAFESLVMGENYITPKAIVQDSNGAVKQLVSGDKDSIGFISLGLVDGSVKALSLDGAYPSFDNVADGSYNLYRPFLFVCGKEPDGPVKSFVDFVFSPGAQAILANEGLIPK